MNVHYNFFFAYGCIHLKRDMNMHTIKVVCCDTQSMAYFICLVYGCSFLIKKSQESDYL